MGLVSIQRTSTSTSTSKAQALSWSKGSSASRDNGAGSQDMQRGLTGQQPSTQHA
jgi:hypothetical protein